MYASISECGRIHYCIEGFQSNINNEAVNCVDSDEMARYEPSHLNLHCLHWYLVWSAGIKGLL